MFFIINHQNKRPFVLMILYNFGVYFIRKQKKLIMRHLTLIAIVVLFFVSCTQSTKKETDKMEEKQERTQENPSEKDVEKIPEYVVFESEDTVEFNAIVKYARSNSLKSMPVKRVVIEIGRYFLGKPYVAHTLEKEGNEKLVINLREVDCTTFVENVTALTRIIKAGKTEFTDFCNELKNIRYRDGKLDGYPSRLHYFSDWIVNNEKKGTVTVISNQIGSKDFDSKVGFMSANPDKYMQLSNKDFVQKIKEQEELIANYKLKYIPKEDIDKVKDKVSDGDIVGISTTVNGLDIAHVGFVIFVDGSLNFMHASSLKKEVVISDISLKDYLMKKSKQDGILLCRINE